MNSYQQIVEAAKATREALKGELEAAKKALADIKKKDKEMEKLIAKYSTAAAQSQE